MHDHVSFLPASSAPPSPKSVDEAALPEPEHVDDPILPWGRFRRSSISRQHGWSEQRPCSPGLPDDFVTVHYLVANPDLWHLRSAEEAARHFQQFGDAQRRRYRRPFAAKFHAALYADTCAAPDPATFWSLHEVLFAGGFGIPHWLGNFDWNSYIAYNSLDRTLLNETQALVHFVTVGVPGLYALRQDFDFDPDFLRDLQADLAPLDDVRLYLLWLEHLLPIGVSPNPRQWAARQGLALWEFPRTFDWQEYLLDNAGPRKTAGRNRWEALEHYVRQGAAAQRAMWAGPADTAHLLHAVADGLSMAGRNAEAMQVYDRCLLLPNIETVVIQHAADLALREGQHSRALEHYRRVRHERQPNFWTYANGAVSALRLALYGEAADWIEQGLSAYPRSDRLIQLFHELQGDLFRRAVNRHVVRLASGTDTGEGIASDLRAILDAMIRIELIQYSDLAEGGPRRPGDTGHRIPVVAMLANCDLPQCTYYRVAQKVSQQDAAGVVLHCFPRDRFESFLSAASTADLAIFYRVAASVETLRCLAYCASRGIPTAYEIDDLVFDPAEFPEPLENYCGTIDEEQHFGLRCGVDLVRFFLQSCDYGIASTEHLRQRMLPLVSHHHVAVHRNALPCFESTPRRRNPPAAAKRITVFYGSGTLAHAADFTEQVEPALLRLLSEFPTVDVLACGFVDVERLHLRFPSQVRHVAFTDRREDYARMLATADINIAVLRQSPFNDSKSEIKWLEAASLGIPSVVSAVGVYGELLKDGTDVVVTAPHQEAWFEALRALVVNPRRRRAIAAAALRTATRLYAPDHVAREFGVALRAIIAESRAAAARVARTVRQRILVVNVFFPPQAIGGATRLVAAQVACLRERHGDDLEIAVLCGNDENAAPYMLTTYDWRGVEVFSINTPYREHMDWYDTDPEVRPVIARVLDRVRPDLVHFHCIQRLSAVTVDEVVARGIPFVVSLHDAWWISDYQFLVDDRNRLCLPWMATSDDGPQGKAASRARRARLAATLGQADRALAVSAPFAQIYRRAGIAHVQVLENGIAALPAIVPQPAGRDRLRLGHFGGTAHIKGLFTVKRTLLKARYPEFELLVVDLAMGHMEVLREMWGATEVRRIGRVPQDQIGWLYGQVDVVLAPSVWPESFGLVVREALHYGKWVVVSNRGALPDAVVEGVNGFIVDLDDSECLARVFDTLRADPRRFVHPPERLGAITGIDAHVEQLKAIYLDVLNERGGLTLTDRRARDSASRGPPHAGPRSRIPA